MCSIVGLEGKFKGNDLIKMLIKSKNRGPDASGIFLKSSSEILEDNIDLYNYNDFNDYDLALGHNLLSIFRNNETLNYQPIKKNNLVLVFNGEIYNFNSLNNFLKKVKNVNCSNESILILELIDFYLNKTNDLVKSIDATNNFLDGDYSYAIYDGTNLAITRDKLGVKPLFYSINNDLKGFASSKNSLYAVGLNDIQSLKPGSILFNWEEIESSNNPWDIFKKVDNKNLEKLLKLSILKRVEDLDEVGLIFSAGVDSSILASILKEISVNKPLKITLYAVGSESSKDVIAARKFAEKMDLPLKVQDINENIVRDNLEDVLTAIGENNIMKIGVGMTIYLASKMIKEDGIKVALSGQGADELFAGYNRYKKSYNEGTLDKELRYDIANMYHVNLERDDAVSMANGVELRLPYLDKKLVEFALNVPIEDKIASNNDELKKNILRQLAIDLGLDLEFALRPKKAAQYGTGIDKILRKKVLKDFDVDGFLLNLKEC